MPSLPLLIATAGVALAATSLPTVMLFDEEGCRGTAIGRCTNLLDNTCCKDDRTPFGFGSASFTALQYFDIAAVYSVLGNKKCGRVKNSQNGPVPCLGAPGGLDGAAWFNCESCPIGTPKNGKRADSPESTFEMPGMYAVGEEGNCTSTVRPDKLTFIDGHTFEIGPTTPDNVTTLLYTYALRRHTIEDLPGELVQYEVEQEQIQERATDMARRNAV